MLGGSGNVKDDVEVEISLAELALTPLDDLLAQANPTLRAVLMRYAVEAAGQPTNARFNAFIE
jgi:hypothetical protein